MDYSIFIVLAVVAASIGLPFAVMQVRKRYGITKQDFKMASDILNVSIMILEELNLEKEDDIVEYATIVRNSIEFASNIDKDITREEIKMQAYEHSLAQLDTLDVEITKRRKEIMMSLINSSMAFYNEKKRLD